MPDVTQKLSVDLERVFPVEQREAAKFLQEHIFPELPENHFFLVGGTALALRFGHRGYQRKAGQPVNSISRGGLETHR